MKKFLVAFVIFAGLVFSGSLARSPQASFKLGIDPTFIPLNTMGQDTRLMGFCQEVFQTVGDEMNDSIELLQLSWDDLIPQLKTGKLDGIITTLNPYNFYKKDFDFSDPFLKTGPCLICTKQAVYKDLKALDGKIIGVVVSSNFESFIMKETTAAIQNFDSAAAVLDALSKGQIDAAFLENLIAHAYTSDLYSQTLVMTTDPYGDFGLRFMTQKTNKEGQRLLEYVNRTIEKSDMSSLLKKWQLPTLD